MKKPDPVVKKLDPVKPNPPKAKVKVLGDSSDDEPTTSQPAPSAPKPVKILGDDSDEDPPQKAVEPVAPKQTKILGDSDDETPAPKAVIPVKSQTKVLGDSDDDTPVAPSQPAAAPQTRQIGDDSDDDKPSITIVPAKQQTKVLGDSDEEDRPSHGHLPTAFLPTSDQTSKPKEKTIGDDSDGDPPKVKIEVSKPSKEQDEEVKLPTVMNGVKFNDL